MNCRKNWKLAAALGAALALVAVLGRGARAETLYTERPAELRSSPADDSQVTKRIGKGKPLEVVKRLGTWVMVKYEGRTGWIRRTALSSDEIAGGGSDDDDAQGGKKSKKSSKSKKADADEGSDDGDEVAAKPGAAGAKRTAARKKSERRKSRDSRRSTGEDDEEAVDGEDEDVKFASGGKKGKKSKSSDSEEDEEMKPRRPRSTWSKRSSIPGGPLKVEIQAVSVQAFKQPDGTGKVVFTAAEGDSVRVIGRAENRWLLVENKKKRQGWIPAVAVRDHGLLVDARKDASELGDKGGGGDEEAPDLDEDAGDESSSGKKTAAASDGDGDDGEVADSDSSSKTSDDDTDTSLDASASDDLMAAKKPWSLGGGLHGGFTAVGTDITPVGANAQATSYSGPTAGLTIDGTYRFTPKIGIVGEIQYDWSTAAGGATFSDNGTDGPEKVDLSHHRAGLTAGLSYGKQAVGIVRLGFQYIALLYSDNDNMYSLPSESTTGPTVGLGFNYSGIADTGFGVRLGADYMLFGSRSQTEGNRDGTDLGSLTLLWGSLMVDYALGEHLTLGGGYRFGYTSANWTGQSERTSAMETDVKDTSHEISLGVGYRL